MGAAGASPCRPFIGQHAFDFISRINVAGARAFSQWERLVSAPADLSLFNMLFILSPELILQEQEHSASGSGCAGPCRPLSGQHAANIFSRIDFAGAGAFSQWERLVPAPADLSLFNMLFIFIS